MHAMIRQITTQLKALHHLPTDITLSQLELAVMTGPYDVASIENTKPTVKIQARKGSVSYTVNLNLIGYPMKKAILTFVQKDVAHNHKMSFGPRSGDAYFSTEQIDDFLEVTGNENPVHQGDFAMVPELMILDWFFEHKKFNYEYLCVQFEKPLHANHHFACSTSQKGFVLMQGDKTLVHIAIDTPLTGDNYHEEV